MPTIKQKKAFNNVVENGGNVSKAMKDANYSENTAKTPQKLTESKGWQELVEENLPDGLLVKVHKEGLQATKKDGVGGMAISLKKGEIDNLGHVDTFIPDFPTRHKYLETAYKIKGKVVDKVDLEITKKIVSVDE